MVKIKGLIGPAKYQMSQLFLYLVLSIVSFVRKYSDDVTKLKIDSMVCEA